MVSERVLDTLVGVAIGLALVVILSSLEERLHIADNSKPAHNG